MNRLWKSGLTLISLLAFSLFNAAYPDGGFRVSSEGGPIRDSATAGTDGQQMAVKRLQSDATGEVEIKWDRKTGVPYLISGKFRAGAAPKRGNAAAEEAVRKFLSDNRALFRMKDVNSELKTKSDEMDRFGLRTIRFSQQYEGIPVYGGDLVASLDRDGNISSVNGTYRADIFIDATPAVTSDEAVAIARAALGLSEGDIHNTIGPELMVYPHDGKYHLAWCLTLVTRPFAEWKCLVSATDGKVIEKWNDAKYQDTMLTGIGVLGETLTVHGYGQNWNYAYWLDWSPWGIPPYWDTNGWYNWFGYGLVDTSKPMFNQSGGTGYIGTVNAGAQDVTQIYWPAYVCARYTTNFASLFSGSNTIWDFSGHHNAGLVYDYWLSHFGRNSINNAGMNIHVNVNCAFGTDYTNAMWSKGVSWFPDGAVFFGRGDWVTALGQSGSLSTVTHELTHGVTQYTCNLEYKYQPGAINEGFSDSFAYALRASQGDPNAHLYNGEGCWLASPGYCRNLQDPHLGYPPDQFSFGSLPANMNEYQDLPLDQDNGGVHINMSIISHCFYLICQSAGVSAGEQIWYRTQTQKCTTTTDFTQLRDLTLQACNDIYGMNDGKYAAVMQAFSDVGIGGMDGGGITPVTPGQWITVTVDVPPMPATAAGYNAYSIANLPSGRMYTIWNNRVSAFRGAMARVGGLPNGHSGTVFNGPAPNHPGDYKFETALIQRNKAQRRNTADWYASCTIRVQ